MHQPKKQEASSTEISREDIRIAREDDARSENLSEEQKDEFELSNTSSCSAQKKNKRASTRLAASKKPVTAKDVKKRKPNSLTDYKEACKEKHTTDKLKLKQYNEKINNGTITDKEKKARLNLIR